MRAMILAAGRGERLGDLTLDTPKPLLSVGREGEDSPLFSTLRALSRAGFADAVINVSHLGEQILAAVGDGERFGMRVVYSEEPSPLETAGGARLALSRGLLGVDGAPFVLVNGDIMTDYDFSRLRAAELTGLCRLVLVPNPPEHPNGDFSLDEEWRLTRVESGNPLTYSGVGLFSPELFSALRPGESARLGPLLFKAAAEGRAAFEVHAGSWHDIGHPAAFARARREWVAPQ